MTITYHNDVDQGSLDWGKLRCGLLTASEMHKIVTPTLKQAANDAQRQHFYELLAQRLTGYVEPHFESYAMARGKFEEGLARDLYSKLYSPVTQCGFVTNDASGVKIGYSPDGLVGDDGLIEVKSRAQKYQVQTILDGVMPQEFMLQVQTGLLVTERKWCDFISYCGGMHMLVVRVYPDPVVHKAIIEAAKALEWSLAEMTQIYREKTKGLVEAERIEYTAEDIAV